MDIFSSPTASLLLRFMKNTGIPPFFTARVGGGGEPHSWTSQVGGLVHSQGYGGTPGGPLAPEGRIRPMAISGGPGAVEFGTSLVASLVAGYGGDLTSDDIEIASTTPKGLIWYPWLRVLKFLSSLPCREDMICGISCYNPFFVHRPSRCS